MAVLYTAEGNAFHAGQPRVWTQTRPLLGKDITWI